MILFKMLRKFKIECTTMSTPKKDNSNSESKISLGAKTDSGYKYSSRVDLNSAEDLSLQIGKLMQEKKAKDELESHIEQIRKIVLKFKNKKKNLDYYSAVGNALSFLNNDNFKNIKPYSVFRRISNEIPDILPELDEKRVRDHLMMMFRISELDKNTLNKASWEKWFEISKFKNVIGNKKTLNKILMLKGNASGPNLREKIEELKK